MRPYLSPSIGRLLVGATQDDDAAVWRAEPGQVVATVDTLVEEIDFRRSWPAFDFRLLGRRLMAVNLSDLAAMGAVPRHALVSVCLPGSLELTALRRLYLGIAQQARRFGCTVAGGDLSGTNGGLVLTAALYGQLPPGGRPLRRAGARAGWTLAVTGSLGGAASGLALLHGGRLAASAAERTWIKRLLDPTPRVEAGRILRESGVAVAGDISDGLYREIERIVVPARLGATVDGARLPLERGVGIDAIRESEDFELLCAAPRPVIGRAADRLLRELGLGLTTIGRLTAEPGIRLVSGGRTRIVPGGEGYDHFS